MSGAEPDPGIPGEEILDRPRAYVRLTVETLAALPALARAVEAFDPVPGPAGESGPGGCAAGRFESRRRRRSVRA